MLCDASATGSIETDGVNLLQGEMSHERVGRRVSEKKTNLVQESQSAVLVSQVAYLLDWSDATAHGINTLECDDLGSLLGVLLQLVFEVLKVVVLEDHALGTRMAHTLDHRGMVHAIGEVNAAREFGTQGGQCCVVCNIARGENESSGLAVKVGEFVLQGEVHRAVASDITGTTSSVAILVEGAAAKNGLEIGAAGSGNDTYCMVSRTTGLLPMPK
jgi:hypothetical protein